jgi:hypothetical protein
MGLTPVVIIHVFNHHPPQVLLIEAEYAVHRLFSRAPNPAFRQGLRLGCAVGRLDGFDAFGRTDVAEPAARAGASR